LACSSSEEEDDEDDDDDDLCWLKIINVENDEKKLDKNWT